MQGFLTHTQMVYQSLLLVDKSWGIFVFLTKKEHFMVILAKRYKFLLVLNSNCHESLCFVPSHKNELPWLNKKKQNIWFSTKRNKYVSKRPTTWPLYVEATLFMLILLYFSCFYKNVSLFGLWPWSSKTTAETISAASYEWQHME